MKPDCCNDCVAPLQFPKKPENRPGLSYIRYRIGAYSDFLEAMLKSLNQDPVLEAWTHRESDDPGIALLEGASVLGDILTFYQELYANEAYLRTASWRESIADLVRLLGYRLKPGVGGRATFAFLIKGKKAVTIPKGFGIKAQVTGFEGTTEFETTQKVTAHPALSKFNLYRPRRPLQAITTGLNQLEIHAVGGSNDPGKVQAVEINEGDRIMLVPAPVSYDALSQTLPSQKKAEILIVSKVEKILDRTLISFEGALTENRGTTVSAYRIDRSFRHFGHNAPAQITYYDSDDETTVQISTYFWRTLSQYPMLFLQSEAVYYTSFNGFDMALAEEVDDLAAGGKLICEGKVKFASSTSLSPFSIVREIQNVRSGSLVWGNLSAASTILTLDDLLILNAASAHPLADLRDLRFHETLGSELTLRAPTEWNEGAFTNKTLNFYATYDDAVALAGKKINFEGQDGTIESATITSKKSDFLLTGRDKTQKWIWTVALDKNPQKFDLEDFDEEKSQVTVYGNLVEATQGKTEKEAILGNGDSRQEFQTFKLPKSPLTYHTTTGETPPEVPELNIYVDGRLWKRVPTLFNHKSDEEVYIIREDANGDSWIQFGDGKTGKRLPSGIKNVVAVYRTGNGAYGALKEETTAQPGGKLDHLDKILLPGVVSGGAKPETGGNAQEAAPGKVQSLDRLVSLKDYECETLAVSGVSKATASWALVENVPSVVITVLMETGRKSEIEQVRKILSGYNRCRGAQRFPVEVLTGEREYVYIFADVAYDPTLRNETIEQAIKAALGLTGEEDLGVDGSEGLFALARRTFGQSEYASRIAGIIQNVDGVLWTEVKSLLSLGVSETPSQLSPPATLTFSETLACSAQRILSLYSGHLKLNAVSAPSTEAC